MSHRYSLHAGGRRGVVLRVLLILCLGLTGSLWLGTSAQAARIHDRPSSLLVTHVTSSSVSLRWRAAHSARAFRVQYSAQASMRHSRYRHFAHSTGRVSGLKPHRRYFFRVRVVAPRSRIGISPYTAKRTVSVVTRGAVTTRPKPSRTPTATATPTATPTVTATPVVSTTDLPLPPVTVSPSRPRPRRRPRRRRPPRRWTAAPSPTATASGDRSTPSPTATASPSPTATATARRPPQPRAPPRRSRAPSRCAAPSRTPRTPAPA